MSGGLDTATLDALAAFPERLQAHYAAIPAGYAHWKPASWEGIPSEPFSAIEQVWHVLDIELEGSSRQELLTGYYFWLNFGAVGVDKQNSPVLST